MRLLPPCSSSERPRLVFIMVAALLTNHVKGNVGSSSSSPQYCYGRYAICSAATCTRTGRTIQSKVTTTGGVATYPEASCECPVVRGKFQALGASSGQMEGSCKQPGKGQVWSMYTPQPRPQALYNYSNKWPNTLVLQQVCPSGTTNTYANCFGFACTLHPKKENGGAQLATCLCPVGSAQDGTPVVPGAAFTHEAGQCNSNYCAMLPVGVPWSSPTSAWQCLGIPPPLPKGK